MMTPLDLIVTNEDGGALRVSFSIQSKDTRTHAFCSDNPEVYKKAVLAFAKVLIEEKDVLIKK